MNPDIRPRAALQRSLFDGAAFDGAAPEVPAPEVPAPEVPAPGDCAGRSGTGEFGAITEHILPPSLRVHCPGCGAALVAFRALLRCPHCSYFASCG
ncbi:MAG: hypothetical protein ACK41D_08360, partial [Rubricoccaceae bacterium]